jgi:prepilin signal peptidase PulO-like enzyme (type II secretory pathway)
VNLWLGLSLNVRLLIIALCGAMLGSFVNWCIYELAWFNPRATSPWSRAPEGLHRTWFDRLPILGWLALRRESPQFGAGHWVRPLLLELALAVGLAALYLFKLNEQIQIGGRLLPVELISSPVNIHAQFVAHALLVVMMLIATFIDFDEQTIPDALTIPGTLLGLAYVACFPSALLLVDFGSFLGPPLVQPLWFTSHAIDPKLTHWFDGPQGLFTGIACFVGWCYVLIPKLCTLRRGLWKGWLYLHASTLRGSAWWKMALVALIGSLVIGYVWQRGGEHWHALLTSLVGMAFGGGLIWAVRIVGFVALRKEAMGFGDVTLMCLVGSFLGWQASIIVFFLAPFNAAGIALLQWIITRRRDIAFGPYLCAGALTLMLNWPWLWTHYGEGLFALGWLVPAFLLGGLLFMMGLLMLWRMLESAIYGPE